MITPLHSDSGNKVKVMPMRDTSAQDRPIDPAPAQKRRRYQLIGAGGRRAVVADRSRDRHPQLDLG